MGWELRNNQLYYYRKRRVDGRVRSIYFGRGERARAAALEDGCPHPAATCATPESAEIAALKKRVEQWPTVIEIVDAGRDFSPLRALYAEQTLPAPGEQLVEWYERRLSAVGPESGL